MAAAKQASGRRPAYVSSIKSTLLSIFRGDREIPVTSITPKVVEQLCLPRSTNRSTQWTYVRAVKILCDFAMRRGYITANPVDGVEPVTVDTPTPAVLTVQQCISLMRWAREKSVPSLAMFSLALFAGIRPDELSRITWQSVRLGSREVVVDAAASKTRRRRIVHLMESAAQWLTLAQEMGSELPFAPRRRIHTFRAARGVLGLPRWPQDVLRHTCASYWYAFERDVGTVAANLGNTPNVLMRHYRQLVETADAKAFWEIRPA